MRCYLIIFKALQTKNKAKDNHFQVEKYEEKLDLPNPSAPCLSDRGNEGKLVMLL